MFRLKSSSVLIVLILFSICLCVLFVFADNVVENSVDSSDKNPIPLDRLHKSDIIYQYDRDIHYSISSNRMIDTYLIAAALYFDFNSQCILPNAEQHELYVKARGYFLQYKDHDFIKDLGKYVSDDDILGDCIGILLSYSNSEEIKPIYKSQKKYMNDVFDSEKEIDNFLTQLNTFYIDTKAGDFFNENRELHMKMSKYIKSNIKNTDIVKLIKETEKYVANSNKYYKENITYQTIVTLFRPSMASFYSITSDDKTILISFQSPNDYSRNPNKFNINILASTTIHELLHSFINTPVVDNYSLITELSALKDKKEYVTDPMYQFMPWNRVIDENLVRAIQGRIYKRVFDEERALKEIIEPQVKYGGFKKLNALYTKLEEYEKKRSQYKTIDEFIPELIEQLFCKFPFIAL